MISMRQVAFSLAVLVAIVLPGAAAEAAIVDIKCENVAGIPLSEELWSFDYDLQVLTLKDVVCDIGLPPFNIFIEKSVFFSGHMDSDSTFTVVENITNQTGVPLTDYKILLANTIITVNAIVEGSTQATGSPEIHQENDLAVELSWLEPIPDGESFMIQFDIFSPKIGQGGLWGSLNRVAIPEPATMMLLCLGSLPLLKKHRSAKGERKL